MLMTDNLKTSIRKLQQDDLAKQLVMRYLLDPDALQPPFDPRTQSLKDLAQSLIVENTMPTSVAEWISVTLFYHEHPLVTAWRNHAYTIMQPALAQALQWLDLIKPSSRR